MRRSQFSHTQIANILKEFEQGKSVEEIHRDPPMVYRKKNKPSTGLLLAEKKNFVLSISDMALRGSLYPLFLLGYSYKWEY